MRHPLTKTISLFHDGYISSCTQEANTTTFKIEVEYLARTYNSNYSSFFLKLYDMQDILLTVYRGDSKDELTDLEEIATLEPGIGRCREVEGRVVIYGDIIDEVDKSEGYSELSFNCSSFALYSGSTEGRRLAEAFDIDPWNFNQHELDLNRINKELIEEFFSDEELERMYLLRDNEFKFYYMPNG